MTLGLVFEFYLCFREETSALVLIGFGSNGLIK